MPTDPREPERTDFDARFAEIIAQLDDEALEKGALLPEPERPRPPAAPTDASAEPSERSAPSDDSTRATAEPTTPLPERADPAPERPQPERAQPEPPQDPPADPIANLPTQWRMPTGEPAPMLEDDGHFEPPAPEPLPAGDLHFWAILGSLIGGPLWLLYLLFFDRYARPMWWLMACGVCVAGVVMLIMRQPANRDDFDEYDDGARL